jgi:hypothetical protein
MKKKTYHVHVALPPIRMTSCGQETIEELWCFATFDRLWKAQKFSQVADAMCCPSLIIDATALTNANS